MKMKKTKIAGLVLILGILLQSNVMQAYAATAAELEKSRVGPIDSSQECSLEIELSVKDDKKVTAISGMKVNIYRVAGLTEQGGSASYTAAAPFDTVSVDYTKLKDASASAEAAKKLSGVVSKVSALQEITNQSGKVKFTNLEAGMYLVVQAEKKDGYTFEPFIISVPNPERTADGNVWEYKVSAQPKAGIKKDVPPSVTPTPAPKPTPKPSPRPATRLVKTGDETNLQFLISLMGISLLGIGCAVIVRKRKNKIDLS